MSRYPLFQFSKREVDRAGRALAGDIVWSEDAAAEIRHIFAVANSWRQSHMFPMRHIQLQLVGQMRKLQLGGVTAARVKRMPSIRKKLRRISVGLQSIQDLGGCRVILPTIDEVRRYSEAYCERGQHRLRETDDYISMPKGGGYRSLHLMLNYADEKYPEYAGRRIEVQVRTHLQHTWATAGEAVGLYRNEDIKAGLGDPDWLRLLQLLASEFAIAEGCPEVAGAPPLEDRRKEIRELDRKLRAVYTLDKLSHAFRYTDHFILDKDIRFLLIQYDHTARKVAVTGYRDPPTGALSYDAVERSADDIRLHKQSDVDAVLVSLDRLQNLKSAFPNYFGDVQLFKEQLSSITRGRGVMEYDLPKQALAPPRPRVQADLNWLKKARYPRPDR